jgi:cytochrome c oxidase assembly protein Cox11
MYELINPVSTASIKINEVEYSLDSENAEKFTKKIEVTTKSIKVEFICDTDDGVEIYDLMCNSGDMANTYMQNENETTTDTVNISKGITITSTNMETIFKANANGIRITTLQGNIIAYFNDKGLSTKGLIVENEAQIVKVLFQEVDDQTWITRM